MLHLKTCSALHVTREAVAMSYRFNMCTCTFQAQKWSIKMDKKSDNKSSVCGSSISDKNFKFKCKLLKLLQLE